MFLFGYVGLVWCTWFTSLRCFLLFWGLGFKSRGGGKELKHTLGDGEWINLGYWVSSVQNPGYVCRIFRQFIATSAEVTPIVVE